MFTPLDIGVDLDGVCYDFADSLRQYLHKVEGRPLESMPPTETWHFYEKQWGMSLQEFIDACNRGVDEEYVFLVGGLRPGTYESMWHLADQGHRLHIITDRSFGAPGKSEENTRRWLRTWDLPYHSLTFSADKTVWHTDIFIDDKPENYDALNAVGHNPWLMDQPWNRHHMGRRVYSWHGFVGEVERLSTMAVAG